MARALRPEFVFARPCCGLLFLKTLRRMNRYPLWKYAIIVVTLLIGVIYTLPNLYGEAPAVQVSPGKMTAKIDAGTVGLVEKALQEAGVTAEY